MPPSCVARSTSAFFTGRRWVSEPLERYLGGPALALSRAVREALGGVPGDRVPYVLFDNYEVRTLPDRPLTRPFGAFNHHSPPATLYDMERRGPKGWRPMITLDTSVLVRYLVDDHQKQASAARKPLAELTSERRGFTCREVSVERARILDRPYGFSRNRIATVFEELAATKEILLEAADDTIRAADGCRRGSPDVAEQMIMAAKRPSADTLYTLDRQDGQLRATALSPAARA